MNIHIADQMKSFFGGSIRKKLIVSAISFCMFFFAVEFLFSGYSMRKLLFQSYVSQSKVFSYQTQTSLNTVTNSLKMKIQSFGENEDVIHMLSSSFDPTRYETIYNTITNWDQVILDTFKDVSNIDQFLLAGTNDFAMSASLMHPGEYLGDDFNFSAFYQALQEKKMIPASPAPMLWNKSAYNKNASVMNKLENKPVFIFEVRDMKGSLCGLLILILNADFFTDAFPSPMQGQQYFLFDANGSMMYTTSNNPAEIPYPAETYDHSIITDRHHEKIVEISHLLVPYNIRICTQYPEQNIMREYKKTFLPKFLLISGCLACIIPISFYLSKKISLPLNLLARKFIQNLQIFEDEDFAKIWMPRYRLRSKIACFYIATIFVPNLIFASAAFLENYKVYNTETQSSILSSVYQTQQTLRKVLNNYDYISSYLSYTATDMGVLMKTHDFSELEAKFYDLHFAQPDLLAMCIIDKQGLILFNSNIQNTELLNSASESVLQKAENLDGSLAFIETRTIASDSLIFIFARPLRSIENLQLIGYGIYFIDSAAFTSVLDNTNLSQNTYYTLWNQDSRPVVSTLPEDFPAFSDEQPDLLSRNASGCFQTTANSQNYFVFFDTTDAIPLWVTYTLPSADISRQVMQQFMPYLFLLLIIIVIIMSISWALALNFTRPLMEFHEKMAYINHDNFDVAVSYRGNDEIGALAVSFNAMVTRLKELLEENLQAATREKELIYLEKEAQLNALQQQINPHFLYNTLESIKWMAYMNGCREVSDMATALGKFFRYAITKSKTLVSLEDEIENLKNYLYIQKIRYEDRFNVSWDIPDNLLEYKVEKLIFQPIVENSLIHGIEKMKTGGMILIKGEYMNGYLKFTVSDNGAGMTEEQLLHLRKRFRADEKNDSNGGIGIVNVYKRLYLYYKGDIVFHIDSAPGKGTSIRFQIPAERHIRQDAPEDFPSS